MRCKQCNYALWQITTRTCPECGSPFKPSDFDFVPNSVRFACPQCDQAYYGTAANGHLIPEAFDCVKCQQPIHMDDMVLLPTEGVEEHRTLPFEMPWLEIGKRHGRFKGWIKTVGCAMVAPERLMRATPRESGVFTSLVFFGITQAFVITLSGSLVFLLPIVLLSGRAGFGLSMIFGMLAFFGSILGVIFAMLILQTAVTHLVVVLTGKHDGGYGRTLQAVAYSSGANVMSAIPCVGIYQPGALWWLVSSILMLAEAQRITRSRATAAVLVLPICALTLSITLVLVLGWHIRTVTPVAPTAPTTLPTPGSSGTPTDQQDVIEPGTSGEGSTEDESGESEMDSSSSDAPLSPETSLPAKTPPRPSTPAFPNP